MTHAYFFFCFNIENTLSKQKFFIASVKSPIDGQLMDGIPSIRVHNGIDYKGATRFIRWTEVFIIKVCISLQRSIIILKIYVYELN